MAMLDRRDVARLLLKAAGLLIALHALIALPISATLLVSQLEGFGGFSQRTGASESMPAVAYLSFSHAGYLVVYIAVGLCLFFGSGRIADRLPIAAGKGTHTGAADFSALEAMLYAVMGVYFLTLGVVDILRALSSLAYNVVMNRLPLTALLDAFAISSYGSYLLDIVVGSVLILRKDGMVALRQRVVAWVHTRRGRPG